MSQPWLGRGHSAIPGLEEACELSFRGPALPASWQWQLVHEHRHWIPAEVCSPGLDFQLPDQTDQRHFASEVSSTALTLPEKPAVFSWLLLKFQKNWAAQTLCGSWELLTLGSPAQP